ncbi:hypothetical protein, partial [Corallococcus sp. AB032C]|uniref:hypothetical protein n=1 Tax=Corallococcus sp. AB032C TaxID=2316717 RepID=UPI001F3417F5
NARGLYTFVNRRYIRDRGLISTVQRAFQDFLPAGRQPVVVLHGVGSPASVTSAESSGSATSARSRATARFWASRSADCSGADRR